MQSRRSKPAWLQLFQCFSVNDIDRPEDQLVCRTTPAAASTRDCQAMKAQPDQGEGACSMSMGDASERTHGDALHIRSSCDLRAHNHGVKRMSIAQCESACSASSTSDWTAAMAMASSTVSPRPGATSSSQVWIRTGGGDRPEARRSLQHQHPQAALAACAESPVDSQLLMLHASASGAGYASTMESQQDVHESSETAATSGSMIRGAVAAAAGSSSAARTSESRLVELAQACTYDFQARNLEFKQPSDSSHEQLLPSFLIPADMFSQAPHEPMDQEAGMAVHQLLLSSSPQVMPVVAPQQQRGAKVGRSAAAAQLPGADAGLARVLLPGRQAEEAHALLVNRRASHEGTTASAATAGCGVVGRSSGPFALHGCPPQASSSSDACGAGFGIYSGLVAERRAKVAAASAACLSQLQAVPEISIQITMAPMLPGRFPPTFSTRPVPSPLPFIPAAHHMCQPITTCRPAAASPPHAAHYGPASPLSGIPEADTSAFLSALHQSSGRASPPQPPPPLGTGVIPVTTRQQPSGGCSWREVALPPPAAGSMSLSHHHLHYHLPPAASLQQPPTRFVPASPGSYVPVAVAPSRLGLQAWQQPQEQAVCNPQLASRVEALRLKLRAQTAELKTISELQQGRKHSRSPAHGGAAAAAGMQGGVRGSPCRSRGAAGAPLAAGSSGDFAAATPSSGLRSCRTMEVEEGEGDEEEERNRHESTMSYLRMLAYSRSNTSFCTRLRRSKTHNRSLADVSPQGLSTSSSMGTRRSILGGMDDE